MTIVRRSQLYDLTAHEVSRRVYSKPTRINFQVRFSVTQQTGNQLRTGIRLKLLQSTSKNVFSMILWKVIAKISILLKVMFDMKLLLNLSADENMQKK